MYYELQVMPGRTCLSLCTNKICYTPASYGSKLPVSTILKLNLKFGEINVPFNVAFFPAS